MKPPFCILPGCSPQKGGKSARKTPYFHALGIVVEWEKQNGKSRLLGGRDTNGKGKKIFLSAPAENKDDFWESDALIWVDWRDFDDSIIKYFNDELPDEDKIQFECVEIEKERGVDIFLHKNGISTAIPYADECIDRDTTLKSIQKYSKVCISKVSNTLVYGFARR